MTARSRRSTRRPTRTHHPQRVSQGMKPPRAPSGGDLHACSPTPTPSPIARCDRKSTAPQPPLAAACSRSHSAIRQSYTRPTGSSVARSTGKATARRRAGLALFAMFALLLDPLLFTCMWRGVLSVLWSQPYRQAGWPRVGEIAQRSQPPASLIVDLSVDWDGRCESPIDQPEEACLLACGSSCSTSLAKVRG